MLTVQIPPLFRCSVNLALYRQCGLENHEDGFFSSSAEIELGDDAWELGRQRDRVREDRPRLPTMLNDGYHS